MENYDVIVVGSGPSGLMCATNIKNKKVLLLEANSTLGGKIKVSGGGRCNVTNNKDDDLFLENVVKNPKFLYSTFSVINPKQLITYFNNSGLKLKEEDKNRMFPQSNKSQSVINYFEEKINQNPNIDYKLNFLVTNIQHIDNKYYINGKYSSQKLVIATGGVTYPQISQGDLGHQLLFKLGHNITNLLPSESPLISNDTIIQEKTLQGISFKNSKNELYINGKRKKTEIGDLIITHFGLSGPSALRLSYHIKAALDKNKKCTIKITPQESIARYDELKLENNQLEINIVDIKGFNTAFLTNGGVNIKEIDSKTFSSKIIKNLYVIGEVLDVHAYTGGYNIGLCLSEGYTCAQNINSK